MNPIKKIIFLAAVVSGIILFWLTPGINKAKNVRYTRVYEDTDKKPNRKKPNAKVADSSKSDLSSKKVYKIESIPANAKIDDIKPSMFSRAIQFREEIKVVEDDSVKEMQLSAADSTKVSMAKQD